MKDLRAELLALFRDPQRTYGLHDLAARLELDFAARRTLRRVVRALCDEGVLARKGGRYGLPDRQTRNAAEEVVGVVSFRANGSAELVTDDGVMFTVLARNLGGALPGDRVAAELLPSREGLRRAASVRAIIKPGPGQILGVFRKAGRAGFLEPREPELFPYHLAIARDEAHGAQDGDLVVAELHAPPHEGVSRVTGRVLEVLGAPNEPSVEVAAIAYHHGLPLEFPEAVLHEVDTVAMEVRAEERAGRVDLRDVPFVTIDGADAKDFDDAVSVRRLDGGFLARIAVADVSHYVRPGTALDEEALARGTSVYFPGRVLPMLPHPLSNGICSLKPEVDRLALVATLELDAEGRVLRESFCEAVIRSHARLTYEEVWEEIQAKRPLRGAGDPTPLVEVCKALNAQRRARGSIDFDIAEPRIVLGDDGDVVDVLRRERNLAHRIVEELMLAANEAVARFFSSRESPTVYRIHDAPDEEKVAAFAKLAGALGFRLRPGDTEDPRALSRFVEALGERPGARALHSMLLRSMKQAQYDVENIGHYGLAATEYLHFTSPIRRYPDLLVHRLLREHLRGRGVSKPRDERRKDGGAPPRARRHETHPYHELHERLSDMAAHSSSREREAMDAEREVIGYFRARVMSRHVGEEMDGRVAGVAPFGLFVEVAEPFVDGLVHVQSIGDDYYEFFEDTQRLVGRGSGRAFALGDAVRVRVDAVNVDRRQVSFGLLGGSAASEERAASRPPARRGGRRPRR